MYTIKWKNNTVSILNQRLLPLQEVYNDYTRFEQVATAIREKELVGASVVGVAVAMGIALASKNIDVQNLKEFKEKMGQALDLFSAIRPTAVNLFWTIDRMGKIIKWGKSIGEIRSNLVKESSNIYSSDISTNKEMGRRGSGLLADGDVVLTYSNAGLLSSAGFGTALGVIRTAIEEGKKIKVYVCETRPSLQGARLTALELQNDKIPVTLITDNMAGHFIQNGIIKKVLVGADEISKNGDTLSTIGTYTLSVLAKEHEIPFYVAAPISIFDLETSHSSKMKFEEGVTDEVAFIESEQIAPEGVVIKNLLFDITPAKNITAIITEKGVIDNPNEQSVVSLVRKK